MKGYKRAQRAQEQLDTVAKLVVSEATESRETGDISCISMDAETLDIPASVRQVNIRFLVKPGDKDMDLFPFVQDATAAIQELARDLGASIPGGITVRADIGDITAPRVVALIDMIGVATDEGLTIEWADETLEGIAKRCCQITDIGCPVHTTPEKKDLN